MIYRERLYQGVNKSYQKYPKSTPEVYQVLARVSTSCTARQFYAFGTFGISWYLLLLRYIWNTVIPLFCWYFLNMLIPLLLWYIWNTLVGPTCSCARLMVARQVGAIRRWIPSLEVGKKQRCEQLVVELIRNPSVQPSRRLNSSRSRNFRIK